jgi:predicted transcriptional regulator
MRTIAIRIDEPTLARLDRLTGGPRLARNRSRIIQEAVRDYVSRLERQAEECEAAVIRRHRGRLVRQAAALIREQA